MMKDKTLDRTASLAVVLYLTWTSQILAQVGAIQFDKPYYFAGEYIFYSIYLGDIQNPNAVLRVVIGDDQQVIANHLHRCSDGITNGYIKLSHTQTSGHYDFCVFAFHSISGRHISLYERKLTIVSTGSEKGETMHFASEEKLRGSMDMPVEPSAHYLRDSNQIVVNLPNPDTSIQYASISVRSTDRSTPGGSIHFFNHALRSIHCLTDVAIAGYRKLGHSDPNRNKLMYGCHPNSLQFTLIQVQDSGRFVLPFNDLYGTQTLHFIDYLSLPIEIRPDQLDLSSSPGVSHFQESDFIRDNFLRYQEQRKIFQLFGAPPRVVEEIVVEQERELPDPDYDIDVQDYALRGTIVDLFKELLTTLKFRKKKGVYYAKVLYESAGSKYFFNSPPVFISNGLATQDAAYISTLAIQEIKRIRIFSSLPVLKKLVGGHRIGGVVVIDMMDPLFTLPDETLLPSTSFEALQVPLKYPISYPADDSLPKIQSLHYWMPFLDLSQKTSENLFVLGSDVQGKKVVEIMARYKDGRVAMHRLEVSTD